MSLLSWYNRCALLTLLLAISAYATASSAPEFAVLAMPTVFALWRMSSRKSGRFLLPRFVVNMLLIAVIAYAVLRSHGNFAVGIIAQVVVLIQIIKIGDRRAPRDDAQILSLGVFLAIAAMLDSNGLWTGLQLAVFLPSLVITVMLFQLIKAAFLAGVIDREETASIASGLRRQLRFTSVFATIGMLGLAFLVFVLLPRGVGANVFPNFGMQRDGRQMAFTSNVTLGGRGILSDSPTIVFDLALRDESGANLGNPDGAQYLRGAVLTEYDGRGRWFFPQNNSPMPVEFIPTERPQGFGQPRGPLIYQTISLRGTPGKDGSGFLFALWRPTALGVKRKAKIWHDFTTHVFRFEVDPAGPFEYTIASVTSDSSKEASEGDRRRRYDSPTVHALASSILTGAGIDPDPAVRPPEADGPATRLIQDYLRSTFSYTLEIEPPGPNQDPIEHFLFERKQGHCEYFAAAMVLLCRSVGIDARMVTGYLATEYNSTTEAYIVRESNAHAWVEAEDGEHRWKRYDPTPQNDLMRIHKPALGLLGRLRHAVEAVEYAWNSSVIAFDEKARQQILGPGGEQAGVLARIDRLFHKVRLGDMPLMLRAVTNALATFAVVASMGVVLSQLIRWMRPRLGGIFGRPRPVRFSGEAASTRFYRDLLRHLSRVGLTKPSWRPPLEHAGALDAVDPGLARDVRGVVDRYYRLRFGGKQPERDDRSAVVALLSRIRRYRPPRA